MKYHYDGYNQIDNYKYGEGGTETGTFHTLLVGMLNGPVALEKTSSFCKG